MIGGREGRDEERRREERKKKGLKEGRKYVTRKGGREDGSETARPVRKLRQAGNYDRPTDAQTVRLIGKFHFQQGEQG